ncbi:MAG: hypothetical protein ABIJ40_09490 [Bacteroidota bacterium]
MIKKNCLFCKKEFFTNQSRILKGNGKYCSKHCHSLHQRKRITLECKKCGKKHEVKKSYAERGYGKFCSNSCYFLSDEVKKGGRSCLGIPRSKETRQKISLSKIGKPIGSLGKECRTKQGENHYAWKGDAVGYFALHAWIRRKWGKACRCEQCGLDKVPEGFSRFFQWANIDHLYKRNKDDWKQLCIKCHKAFDGLASRKGKYKSYD